MASIRSVIRLTENRDESLQGFPHPINRNSVRTDGKCPLAALPDRRKKVNRKSFAIAAAAAAIFAAGGATSALADHHEGGEKIKCDGVNGCKGESACATADNSCAGENGCKGKGFLKLTKAECDAAKADMKE